MTFEVVDGAIILVEIVVTDGWEFRVLERPDRIHFEAELGDAKAEVTIQFHDGALRVETRVETGD